MGPRVVAFGGGHGLAATLRALRHITHQITAVVTVADDGGSSGRIREETPVLPPGDLRMALVSLCDNSEWSLTWRDLMQLRLKTDGPLDDHALGNLLIVGLWQMFEDPVVGLDWLGRLLDSHGRVLPMSSEPLRIEATVREGEGTRRISGQTQVAEAGSDLIELSIEPRDAAVPPQTIAAIGEAEWIILGPGSWFTSVIPHLLLEELHRAIVTTPAHRALVLNLTPQSGETAHLSAADLVREISSVSPDLKIDVVIADPTAVEDIDDLMEASAAMGARVLLRQVRSGTDGAVHDPLRLASALRDAFDGFLGEVGKAEAWLD
ncbi:gluconeogenesis factor YvcK family protein [Actinomyces minihominis]|uniref:gluconeogenesis factor YvcK family protein n=1 Tax=Actinomyces minihominis TaxID=2002838 RepID=UPI000C06B185|nr:uridine diphosphate-N-acetylglucosamine-binding protein YvcK [Actinomyces minihominis]